MGFFSWKCAKSKKAILNQYVEDMPFAMLIPSDMPITIIEADYYDGYGRINGMDIISLQGLYNLDEEIIKEINKEIVKNLKYLSKEEIEEYDEENEDALPIEELNFEALYNKDLKELKKMFNSFFILQQSNKFVCRIENIAIKNMNTYKKPLKLVISKYYENEKYEDLGKSEFDSNQGLLAC